MTKTGEQGFTLVEMLTVLSLVALMSGLILTMTGQFRGLILLERSLTGQAALQKTADHIAALINNAEAIPLDMGRAGVARFMIGTGNSVALTAVSRHQDSSSGLSHYSIFVVENEGRKDLVEALTPRRADTALSRATEFILLQDVENLSFSFLGVESSDDNQLSWRQDWSIPAKLPAAVRVVITKREQSGKRLQASSVAYLAR